MKRFYDIHCLAMNLSHPNILAFLNRVDLRLALLAGSLLGPLVTFFAGERLRRIMNLLAVMENDAANLFLLLEYSLKAWETTDGRPPLIRDGKLMVGDTAYDRLVLTPLMMDFGCKNIRAGGFYRIPPQKPIVEQVVDLFNGIAKYTRCELLESSPGRHEIVPRQSQLIFEIFPFLGINTKNYTVLDRPIESETSKIVENSYRATTLAFLNEWSLFAERNGVDLIKVIKAIKVRPTHSNMIFPGPGIGGYCLPKDGGLGVWSYQTLMGFEDDIFKITPLAIDINDTRSLHVAELVRDALRNMGKIVAASKIALLGASYREDVGDTRYSGSEIVVRKLTEMGAEDEVINMTGRPFAIIDCFGILNDEKIKRYFELGCEVKGLGRGHVKRIKDTVKLEK